MQHPLSKSLNPRFYTVDGLLFCQQTDDVFVFRVLSILTFCDSATSKYFEYRTCLIFLSAQEVEMCDDYVCD